MARLLLALVFILLFYNANAQPPLYDGDKVTVYKIEYCNRLVREFGHLSQEYNSKYGVTQIPNANNWEIRLHRPTWSSNKLLIIYDQTIPEENILIFGTRSYREENFEHRFFCEWEFFKDYDRSEFTFYVRILEQARYSPQRSSRNSIVCTSYGGYELPCPEKN